MCIFFVSKLMLLGTVLRTGNASIFQDVVHKLRGSNQESGCIAQDSFGTLQMCVSTETNESITPRAESVLPPNTVCFFQDKVDNRTFLCLRNGVTSEIIDIDSEHHRRTRRFIEWIFVGIIGAAWLGGLICSFVCKAPSSEAPNKPPKIDCSKSKISPPGNPRFADKNQTSVAVTWTDCATSDPEGKTTYLKSATPDYTSGMQYVDGSYRVVYFAYDGQLSSIEPDAITFSVKVITCPPPGWPPNGYITPRSFVYGDLLQVTCNKGFEIKGGGMNYITCDKNHQNQGIWSNILPQCTAIPCEELPDFDGTTYLCPKGRVYDQICIVVCAEGYTADKEIYTTCNELGKWKSTPKCKDATPPRFTFCPLSIFVTIDAPNGTAEVDWELPNAADNSNDTVTIQEVDGRKPKTRFYVGTHTIRYQVIDRNGNQGTQCIFTIKVESISCDPPDLQVDGKEHMIYDCPNLYLYGAECSLSCQSGYPLVGTDIIRCEADPGTNPPVLRWKWDSTALSPYCRELECHDLEPPANGALACDMWDHGRYCQMQCQVGFDIPLAKPDGFFVCGKSDGKWRPDSNVPDCDKRKNSDGLRLPSEFYYFTGVCNSSAENLEQIRENFIKALNSSFYREACSRECHANFVDIKCGPVTQRKRRSTTSESGLAMAYIIEIELFIPLNVEGDDSNSVSEDILYDMATKIEEEVRSGHFSLDAGELRNDSFYQGRVEFVCPPGMVPKSSTATCIGCPVGMNLVVSSGKCEYCPIGSYQDEVNSIQCKLCPHGTSTLFIGAKDITACLGMCSPGTYSLTRLSPCVPCHGGSYQPESGKISCIPCPRTTTTSNEGATSENECEDYDLYIKKGKGVHLISPYSLVWDITYTAWIFIMGKTNETTTLLRIESFARNSSILINLDSEVYVETNEEQGCWKNHTKKQCVGNFRVKQTMGFNIERMEWFHLSIVLAGSTNSLNIYANGQKKGSVEITNWNGAILAENDSITMQEDMYVRSFVLLNGSADALDVTTWSKSCMQRNMSGIFDVADLALAGGVTKVVPSRCDDENECLFDPCGGHTCINKLKGFECVCSKGFTGSNCETPPDPCSNHACLHGGQCIRDAENYTCTCAKGYKGVYCEIMIGNGQWSEWTEWSRCSLTCNGGRKVRSRMCNNPPPEENGDSCPGADIEISECNTQRCPECLNLPRSEDTQVSCTEMDELKRCNVTCSPGFYFATPALPFYECGAITNYTWNHVSVSNPSGRLPSCSKVKAPAEISVAFVGTYAALPCTTPGAEVIADTIQTKTDSLPCVQNGTCTPRVSTSLCIETTRQTRSTSHSLGVVMNFTLNIDESDDLQLEEFFQNDTISPALLRFVHAVVAMEMTGRELMNTSQKFFEVVIEGESYSLEEGDLRVTRNIACSSGFYAEEAFCIECPIGTYDAGDECLMCPIGFYQDVAAHISCRQCPSGTTTEGIGSMAISECSVRTGVEAAADVKSTNPYDSVTMIAVIVSVVSVALIIAGTLALIKYKRLCRRRDRKVGNSLLDLQVHQVSQD